MALTQDQIAQQIVAQLRVLDPSASAEVGTPERKIIDTVAQAIAEAQVDLNILGGKLDLDTKYGTDLDNFVGLFGFGRQSGAYATGFVTFGRQTPSAYNIAIPRGTQVSATVTSSAGTVTVVFQTTLAVTLLANTTSIVAPIQALQPGAVANVAANTITQFANLGSPPLGITTVTNTVPTTGGSDSESDAELKVRFRNTVFRNVSGTEDQFLAVAVSGAYTTKANVIGPVSRYQEYVQIPLLDDAGVEASGTNVVVQEPDGTTQIIALPDDGWGNGSGGQWTTLPSGNPYAKWVYTDIPYFASNGQRGTGTVFYRQDSDFTMNVPPLNAGDTFRESSEGDTASPSSTQPNFTFFNVYTGSDITVLAPRPNDVVLVEYAYLSAESRNDVTRGVTNCVDVYVNGANAQTADAVMAVPSGTTNLFSTNTASPFYVANFRRIGQPNATPTAGHIFMGLYWQPVLGLPSQIVVGGYTFYLGIHYFAVEEVTLLRNTVRARNGIEWTLTQGQAPGDPAAGPYTGPTITNTPGTGGVVLGATTFTVSGYGYDRNVIDLQTAIEGVKQVTTDVLVHRAAPRYLKFDLTVVYSPGASTATTNLAIQEAVQTYLANQYFGSVIQLSDILLAVRNVTGVQNVRWTNDVVSPSDDGGANFNPRVLEIDVNGNPLQAQPPGLLPAPILSGSTTSGTSLFSPGSYYYVVTAWLGGGNAANESVPSTEIVVNVSSSTQKVSLSWSAVTTSEPIQYRVYRGTTAGGENQLLTTTSSTSYVDAGGSGTSLTPSQVYWNVDFAILDSELPGLPSGQLASDTLPGLIIRPRAQNVFSIV